jgi:hypothetical protein
MEPRVEEIRRALYGGQNPPLLLTTGPERIVLRVLFLRQRNVVSVGKIFDGIDKSEVLMFCYKTENVAPASTSETVVELVLSIYLERRGFFLVKRAQPDVTVARPAQLHRLANHIDNVDRLLYDGGNAGTSQLATLPAEKETALGK